MVKNTFQTVMAEVASAFEKRTRHESDEGGRDVQFYCLKDDAPEWLRGEDGTAFMWTIHDGVDGRFPDDWIYEHTMRVAQTFTEYDECTDRDSADVHEVAAGLVDVYTAALTEWLSSHLGNVALCDEAQAEWGGDKDAGLDERIRKGQHMALERIAYTLLDAVTEQAEARDSAAEG